MPPEPTPVDVRVPRAAWVALALAGLALLGLLGVLVAVLLSLEGTRSELRDTRAGVGRLDGRVDRVTGQLQPLADAAAPLGTPAVRRQLERSQRTLTDAALAVPPLAAAVPALASDARQGVALAGSIAEVLRSAQLDRTLAAVQSIAGTLRSTELEPTLRSVRALAAAATADGSLRRAVTSADRALSGIQRRGGSQLECDVRLRTRPPVAAGQVGCLLRTIPNIRVLLRSVRDVTGRSLGVQRRTLEVNTRVDGRLTESLQVQRELLATGLRLEGIGTRLETIGTRVDARFAESLDIQRELLVRARSIDTKIPPLTPTSALTTLVPAAAP